jgi:hypothetical protein
VFYLSRPSHFSSFSLNYIWRRLQSYETHQYVTFPILFNLY